MTGAKGVIISIIGGEDMKLLEVDEAANHIRELVDEDANIIFGSGAYDNYILHTHPNNTKHRLI